MKKSACIWAACALLAACHKAPETAPDAPRVEGGETVIFPADSPQLKGLTTLATTVDTKETLRLSGRIAWDETRTVRVFAPLGGRIVKLLAQPGDKVKAGDTLITLTSPDFGAAQSEAAKAAADFGVAQKALERARELHEAGIIADKDMEQTNADYASAAAEKNRTAARTKAYGSTGAGVDQQFSLRAPIAGLVVERHANPGQEVRSDGNGDTPLFVISDPSRLWVNLDLPESALGVVKPGMKVALRMDMLGTETVEAVIEHVDDFIDPDSRHTRARAVVDNRDRHLKAEMFTNADVVVDRGEYIGVPATAIILLGRTQYVFVEDAPGKFRRQVVVAEESSFGNTRVRQGLKAGDKIVSDGGLLLQKIISTEVTK